MVFQLAAECALPMDPLLLGAVIGIAVVLCVTLLVILLNDWFERG